MATPARMIELKCPQCSATHWERDADFPGMDGDFIEYSDRAYTCPSCARRGAGYGVLQKSPPATHLHPDDFFPLSEEEFAYWQKIRDTHFPSRRKQDQKQFVAEVETAVDRAPSGSRQP